MVEPVEGCGSGTALSPGARSTTCPAAERSATTLRHVPNGGGRRVREVHHRSGTPAAGSAGANAFGRFHPALATPATAVSSGAGHPPNLERWNGRRVRTAAAPRLRSWWPQRRHDLTRRRCRPTSRARCRLGGSQGRAARRRRRAVAPLRGGSAPTSMCGVPARRRPTVATPVACAARRASGASLSVGAVDELPPMNPRPADSPPRGPRWPTPAEAGRDSYDWDPRLGPARRVSELLGAACHRPGAERRPGRRTGRHPRVDLRRRRPAAPSFA